MDNRDRVRCGHNRASSLTGSEQTIRIHSHSAARHCMGAFLATFIGQTVGWYRADQGAGFIGATAGAIIVLFVWNRLVAARVVSDPGAGPR